MPIPTHTLVKNLRFTTSGTVWADFLLSGVSYGLRPDKEKATVRQMHQALFRSLGGEALLLGLTSGKDPEQLVAKMMEGVDPAECPDWVAECEATLASLDDIHPGQRIYWLSLPLASSTPWAGAGAVVRTSLGQMRSQLGMPRNSPSAKLVDELVLKAAKAVESVPAGFRVRPATAAQMVWLHQHMLDRGLFQDWDLPSSVSDEVTPAVVRSKAGTAMVEPLLDEGGQTDLEKVERAKINPFRRRYLKVQDQAGDGLASYQSLLVIGNVPDRGMPFPDGELIGRIDESGISTDWAIRLHVRSSAEVMVDNKRALNAMNEQLRQRDGELSHSVSALDGYASLQAEYAAIFEADKLEVEVQATMILCVSGPDAESATVQSKALADWISQWGYRAVAPLGQQGTMWWAMVPGMPASSFVREYAQITTSTDLAALCPLATVEVGDAKGSILALNIGHGPMLAAGMPCGPAQVVFHDPDGATDRNESGSIAVSGDLGAGKSVTLKKVAGDVLDRGGRVIVPDRTEMGEWAKWARSITRSKIVDVVDPSWSLDPLRLFGAGVGSRMTQSLLGPLLNVSPTSDEGMLLADALDPTYLERHSVDSMGALVAHLGSDRCDLPSAKAVARKLNVFARQSLCRVIFDADLPPIQLSDRAVVILTHSLELPTNEELNTEHLFAQLSVEKIFGRALYAFIAVLAERVCFEDADTLAAFVVDEAHFVTSSSEGVRVVTRFVRDGRKHRAVVALGSQDAIEDFPSEVLRGLIPTRLLMRHTDKRLAQRGLEWLGLDAEDDRLIDLITKDTSPKLGDEVPLWRRGEALMRDAAGNIGRVKVLGPAVAARNQAGRTGGRRDLVGTE